LIRVGTYLGRDTVSDNNLTWRKSTRSGAAGHCVEVAETPAAVYVRDSKDVTGPMLRFAAPDWAKFIDGVRNGEFDRR
jgi:predicted secreted Zn-dependent protease